MVVCWSMARRCFNPRREAPPRATYEIRSILQFIIKVSIPGGKPLHEPPNYGISYAVQLAKFQSQAGSPSTSHPGVGFVALQGSTVSIPGGKPLHEPPCNQTCLVAYLTKVSIPGGKPLHEPPLYQSSFKSGTVPFQSQAGSPSTSHSRLSKTIRTVDENVSIPGGKPLHEPPCDVEKDRTSLKAFQSQAGSPSTSHHTTCGFLHADNESFNPRREAPPRATKWSIHAYGNRIRRFNPRREAPPRATSSRRNSSTLATTFQSQAGSPSTSHQLALWASALSTMRFNPRREAPPRATATATPTIAVGTFVSIPGGKPLHEPPTPSLSIIPPIIRFNPRREAPPRATRNKSSYRSFLFRCFNPRREAPPRATGVGNVGSSTFEAFQSQAGSPSTSHLKDGRPFCNGPIQVSIPGGKPLHEPPINIPRHRFACSFSFNPRREAPPRATYDTVSSA